MCKVSFANRYGATRDKQELAHVLEGQMSSNEQLLVGEVSGTIRTFSECLYKFKFSTMSFSMVLYTASEEMSELDQTKGLAQRAYYCTLFNLFIEKAFLKVKMRNVFKIRDDSVFRHVADVYIFC